MSLPEFRGQLRQDEIVYTNFFKNKKNGTFLDIGAHDGIEISNTKFYEDIGWKGICVEAIPEIYARLCENRPGSICEWGAVYNKNGEVSFRVNSGYTEALSGVEEAYDDRHVSRIEKEQIQHGGSSKLITVPCFTVTSLLEKHNMNEIDFMSLDVEGAEVKVLQGIDFSKILIKVITIEDNYNQENEYDAILLPAGYKKLGRISWDVIYFKNT
jgi:FkbM family methyltransferase